MFFVPRGLFSISFLWLAVWLAPSYARGEVVLLRPAADTTLFQTESGHNLGALETFISGTTQAGMSNRALLRFDLAGRLPADATVRSVSLTLTVTRSVAAISNPFRLHRMLGPWQEGLGAGVNVGVPAGLGESTWLARFHPDTLWSEPGVSAGIDCQLSPSGEAMVGVDGPSEFLSTDQMVNDVEFWRTNAAQNFGWILVCGDETTLQTARRFASKEAAAGQPELKIEYVRPERQMVDLVPDADTSLFEYRPFNNLGGSELAAGSIGVETNRSRALLRFDVSEAVPADAVITAARLDLHLSRRPSADQAGSHFELHRMRRFWAEGNKLGLTGSLAQDGEATWYSRVSPDEDWSVPGGGAPVDFDAGAESRQFVNSYGWYSFEGVEPAVSAWLADPGHNFGWMLMSDAEEVRFSGRRFESRESSINRPTLHIEYGQAPRIQGISLTNRTVSLTFANLARNRYSIESREGLHTGDWKTLAVLPPSETSGPRTVTLPQTTSNLFYRIAWRF